MLLVAIAIRMESKGAVIYRSTRIGAGYKEFNFWKFRSMYADADSRLDQMNNNNQYGSDATFKKFVKCVDYFNRTVGFKDIATSTGFETLKYY